MMRKWCSYCTGKIIPWLFRMNIFYFILFWKALNESYQVDVKILIYFESPWTQLLYFFLLHHKSYFVRAPYVRTITMNLCIGFQLLNLLCMSITLNAIFLVPTSILKTRHVHSICWGLKSKITKTFNGAGLSVSPPVDLSHWWGS